MSILVLLTLGGLAVANYRTCRDVRYPPFIMNALWLLAVAVYYIVPFEINRIGIVTVLIFISTIIAFSGGGQLALTLRVGNPRTQEIRLSTLALPGAHPPLKIAFLVLSAAALPLMIQRAYQLASQSGYDVSLIGLRTELLASDSGAYGPLSYAATLSFVTTFLYAIEPRKGIAEKLESYLSLAISVAYAILTTGRTTIFFILAVLAGIAMMRGKFNFKRLVLSAVVFLLAFAFFGIATGKGGNPDAPWSENISSIGESLLVYGVGPLPAFDQVVRANRPLEYGKNMFIGPLNTVRGAAGSARVSRLRDEVYVPFPANVYTGINAPYLDFGVAGVIVVFFVIGASSAYFYLRGLAGDPLYVFYYAISLYPLLLVTFSDEYFDPLNDWIKFGLCAYLYFRIRKRRESAPILAELQPRGCQ